MFKLKGVRNILFAIAAFCSMHLIAQSGPIKFNKQTWSLYPQGGNVNFGEDKTIKDNKNSSGKITSQELTSAFTIYTYIPVLENKSYKIYFQYMMKDCSASSIDFVLHFNKKNGDNGSAGSVKFPVNIDSNQGWQMFSTETKVPPEAELCQIAINFSGFKGTLRMGDLSIEEVKDSFVINKTITVPKIDGKLDDDCWEKAIPLKPFYYSDNAKPAKTETTAFITYDNKNIYIAMKNSEPQPDKLLHKIKERDGSLWDDDSNEIFIAVSNDNIFQFTTNSDGVQWDGRLFIKMPGDPYSVDAKWNGVWKSASTKDKDSWTTEICIPFSTLQIRPPSEGDKWYINLARERKVDPELSHFNKTAAVFNNAAKFACLEFSKKSATLKRYSEAMLSDPFKIARKSPKFKELLSGQPGNYVLCSWSNECTLASYPPSIREKYTPETFAKEQDAVLTEFGEAGLLGPVAYPWAPDIIGMKRIKDFNKKYNTKYWFTLTNSSLYEEAIKNGAKFYSDGEVNPCDPEFQKVLQRFIKEYCSANKEKLAYLQFIYGTDEPMDNTYLSYSITKNEKNKEALIELDAKIKKEFGFGKYGLYDTFAKQVNPELASFNMIAFTRWWNNTFAEGLKKQKALVNEYAPGIQFQAYTINFTGSMTNEDAALISQYTDCVSVDPYPTSAMYNYGRDRAVYHTGFSLKIGKDLAGGKPITGILQAFSYCGATPTTENLREWASQALKNGADVISWYACGSPIRVSLPEIYKETLRISNIVHKMNKVAVPSETKTAIFFSCPSYWGNFDKAAHSYYTIYSILGENLKTWFRFVSDSEIKLKIDDLSKYRVVYAPQLKFTDADTATMLLEYVKNGGKLVILDPEAFTWNIDGTKFEKMRNELVGCPVGKAVDVKSIIASADYSGLKKGDELPLTPLAHIANSGKVLAFEIIPPTAAKIIANYPDGKPAAFERTVGKGSVIYFAAQPFGNSDLAVKDSKWLAFMKGITEEIGEKLDLPIWDFELSATGGEIEVRYVVKPM